MPGETLTEQNIWVKRPGGGDFNVNDFEKLIGKKCIKKIKKGYQLKSFEVDLS